ncbi:MAG: metallophosphoesterase [Saprospiraceae bacterium]
MKKSITFLFGLFASLCLSSQAIPDTLTFGVIADCQYCHCPATTQRFYKLSPGKLTACIAEFNQHELAFAVHLGDYIDRNFESFDTLQPIINQLKTPLKQVLGNHDFSVEERLKKKVPKRMGMKHRYYSFKESQWRFIVLDGNDLSTFATFAPKKKREAAALLAGVQSDNKENAQTWNGGLSSQQMKWLKKQLEKAESEKEKVILFCHFPIYPSNPHNLWNDTTVMQLLASFSCVKAYFNGHNHAGHYGEKAGIHYLTFKGMVDTETQTAFSIVKIVADQIIIEGFGRQEDQILLIK